MKKVLAAVLLVMALSALFTAPAFATANTKLTVIHDTADGAIDNLGPAAGFCNYNQNAAGDLRVVFHIMNGRPNTTYNVSLYNGPTWTTWTKAMAIGTLTTDDEGRGNTGGIWCLCLCFKDLGLVLGHKVAW